MKAQKILIFLLVIVLIIFTVSNSSSIYTIDELAYVLAIGFDVGSNGRMKLSFQIALPSSSSSSSSESSGSSGSSSQSSSSVITTVESNTLDTGINLVNSYISEKIDLSHCKVVVFSEELAASGISSYISTLINNIEIRPTCNILISKCDAKYFLENSKPILNQLSSKYYEIESSAEKSTGYSQTVTINDFYTNYFDTLCEPYAILASVNGASEGDVNSSSASSSLDNFDYTASELPISSQKNIENLRPSSI